MKAASRPIKLLIVDDHPVVRAGLSSMLAMHGEIEVMDAVATCADALRRIGQEAPDIILLDLRMPGMDGVAFLELPAETRKKARVIVLTSYERDEEIYRAVQAGAQGYLTKDASEDEMVSAILRVHEGRRVIPPHIAARLADRLMRSTLTAREIEILKILAEGLTNRQIGKRLSISENTVRNHVKSLLDKLEVADRTEAATIAIRRGIIQMDQ
ncbi:response regulator transcription factor [Acidipila sp. EB88]|uniref:response regulator n=1 Tax=Acidipila sp. EB88 TaxID=2305226 RepID=UPI000F5F4AF8|nr:response regulator transcription factor [Acidipila sp. EB88]RRA49571.1 DNA-binding response regulator [Acidipila sp. EB88]